MNKNTIDRTLIWFKTEEGKINSLCDDFFGLSILLNRLLNESYNGQQIEIVNINLATEETYQKFPAIPMNYTHYYGGHLNYYGLFDKKFFDKLDLLDSTKYVWEKVYHCLCDSADSINNSKLRAAVEYAYNKGNEINLSTDYRVVEKVFDFNGLLFKASVWIYFKGDGMYSRFTLEQENKIIYQREIDKTEKGVEFFLDIYKDIEFIDDSIIIKGHKDVDYLPLKIPIPKNLKD